MTVQREIALSREHEILLRQHAKRCEPNESCAILLGRDEGGRFSISEIILTENIDRSPATFSISGEELITAYGRSEKMGLDVAIFHSHPQSAPYPSMTDRRYMEVNPVPWLIYSNLSGEMMAYILESDIIPLGVKIL